jgi:hypothetical protein
MIDDILTNYKTKFINSQLDNEYISKSKLYYNIYNNKISQPLQKFWFSVPNIKYSNNYSDFKTIRFLMNNKNDNISKLINYIKDISNYMIEKLSPIFENITIDYPWKESIQYPYIFTFFTNKDTIFIDSSGNEIDYNLLNQNDSTYSIIFEISSIRIIPIKLDTNESHTIKINLVLNLIKQDEKKDLKKYIFTNYTTNTDYTDNECRESNINLNLNNGIKYNTRTLPFLNDISSVFSLNKTDKNLTNNVKNQSHNQTSSKLIINTDAILKAINGLKKVEIKKEQDDNDLQINTEYTEKKNSLKKVKTKEKSLLNNLQKKKKKKKKEKQNIIEIDNQSNKEQENIL